MSQRQVYVLDTYALMAFFLEEIGYDVVQQILWEHVTGKSDVLMTEVNWGEFFYMMAKKKSLSEAERRLAHVERIGIILVPADRTLIRMAANLKIIHSTAKAPLSYADCFAAALAQLHSATLITGDHEFKSLETIISIRWLR